MAGLYIARRARLFQVGTHFLVQRLCFAENKGFATCVPLNTDTLVGEGGAQRSRGACHADGSEMKLTASNISFTYTAEELVIN